MGKFKEKIVNICRKIAVHPEEVESKFLDWFDFNKRFAFLTALIVGIITHITFITEMIFSQDGLWNSLTYSIPSAWEFSIGRWGIFLADKLVNNLAIPNITGIASIFIIAIATVFVVDVLKLKNKITIFLSSVAMVVAPTLTTTMIFSYTSVAYCTAMLLTVVTVWLIFKEMKTYIQKIFEIILAIILFVISLGIYQSYIGVVIGLTVMRLIRDLFDDEISTKNFFINGMVMVIIVLIGGVVYLGVTEIILNNMGLELSSYKGTENIGIKNTLTNLPSSIKRAYKDFCSYYLNDLIVYNEIYSRDLFYKIMFASVFILEAILMFTKKIYKKTYKMILIAISNAILPIALNAVLLLTTDTSTYVLTAAQLILMIPFSAMICEIAGKNMNFIFRWATLISMLLIVFTYYLADNVSYHCLKQTYNQAYTTVIRIVDRIEQTEGYTKEGLVLINGIIETNMDYRYQRMSPLGDYTVGMFFKECPVFHGTYSGMEGTWMNFFTNYMGMKVQLCAVGDYQNIVQTPEYQEMGIWPAEDSVKLINNIIVVKLREQAIMP